MINFDLDKVRHGKVEDFMTPGELEDDIGMKKIVTLVETAREAIEIALLQEPGQKLFGDLGVLRLGRVLHGVLVELVLFA